MGNLNNGDMLEICSTVTMTVMEQVRKNLSEMKPTIMQEILSDVINNMPRETTNQNNELESAKRQLLIQNDEICDLKNEIKDLRSKMLLLDSKLTKISAVPEPISKLKNVGDGNGVTKLAQSQIQYIMSLPNYCRIVDGWVYYINCNDRFLYRVKTDGRNNEKIFEENVSTYEYDAKHNFNVKGNTVYFKDSNNRDRSITIRYDSALQALSGLLKNIT